MPAFGRGYSGFAPTIPQASWTQPDIIEWVCSDRYLDRPRIYPRQATLLKLIFLEKDALTEYDYDVLDEWSRGFRLPDPERELGQDDLESVKFEQTRGEAIGITPDWETRMDICIDEGRPWFREVMPIIGRRGSKGHVGAISVSRVIGEYISKGDPQEYFGVDRDKRLQCIVFAGKRDQAKVNQWQDIVNVVLGSPYLSQFVARPLAESLSMYAPADALKMMELEERGLDVAADNSTFLIIPKESTLMAGRGPTSFCQCYDEMAHVVATGANRSAEEVYEAATPALDQFGKHGFIYSASSPWQMTGKLYDNYLQALSVDPTTHAPLRPEMLMVQLASWDLYKDWEYASSLPMMPDDHSRTFASPMSSKIHFPISGVRDSQTGVLIKRVEKVDKETSIIHGSRMSPFAGKTFFQPKGAIQEYDEQMKRLERANPDTFRVERLSQWASSMDAYLDRNQVMRIFEPYDGERLAMRTEGNLSIDYYAHGDPSESGDNFGWAIGHREGPDENGMYHVVFDKIHAWLPSDYENNRIDYIAVEDEIIEMGKAFNLTKITFDQFGSAGLIQRVQRELRGGPKATTVTKKAATGPLNWLMAETFKTAMNLGLIHAPYHELAELELRFLRKTRSQRVDHQTSGPVQTKDVADAMFNVVHELIGEQMGVYLKDDLATARLSASMPADRSADMERQADVFSSLGSGGGMPRHRSAPHASRVRR